MDASGNHDFLPCRCVFMVSDPLFYEFLRTISWIRSKTVLFRLVFSGNTLSSTGFWCAARTRNALEAAGGTEIEVQSWR
jgi:hypothetical protein